MRRFYLTGCQAFCMMAAFLLALAPLSHGLHLASCNHANEFYDGRHPGHAPCTHLSSHRHERVSQGTESERVTISCSQANGGHVHDPSTCPVCQTFAQLMQGQGPPPSPSEVETQETCQDEPSGNQSFCYRTDLANGYARAPPAC